jgi:hypothetical protein
MLVKNWVSRIKAFIEGPAINRRSDIVHHLTETVDIPHQFWIRHLEIGIALTTDSMWQSQLWMDAITMILVWPISLELTSIYLGMSSMKPQV